MPENTFDTTWLNTRFPFDEAARSPQVDQACLSALSQSLIKIKSPQKTTQNPKPKPKKVNLLDVGSGTGANFLHFFEKLPVAQNWYFLDHDPRLLQASLQRIEAYATEQQYPVLRKANGLELQRGDFAIAIQVVSGSFEVLEELVPLEALNLVMASAFFDLFTPVQLQTFLDKIFAAKCSLLLTLNYAAMTFAPTHPLDKAMVGWYEAHMQRPKAEGILMGPNCSRLIRSYLEKKEGDFLEGSSVWKIGKTDQAMLRFLLGFMEEAIGELGLSEGERGQVAKWLSLRKAQVEANSLSLDVAHFDFFALT